MQRIEEYRTLSRRIKYIKGKFMKPDTILVTKQQTDGSTLETTEKISPEKAIIEENMKIKIRPKDHAHYSMTLGCT